MPFLLVCSRSVGVLAYAMLSFTDLFGGSSNMEIYSNVSSQKIEFDEDLFEDVSDDALEFMLALLNRRET